MKPRAPETPYVQTIREELTKFIESGDSQLFAGYMYTHNVSIHEKMKEDLLLTAINIAIRARNSDKRLLSNCLQIISRLIAWQTDPHALIKSKGSTDATPVSLMLQSMLNTPEAHQTIKNMLQIDTHKASSITLAIELPFILQWLAKNPGFVSNFMIHYPDLPKHADFKRLGLRILLEGIEPFYHVWSEIRDSLDEATLFNLEDTHREKLLKIVVVASDVNNIAFIVARYPDLLRKLSPLQLLQTLQYAIEEDQQELIWSVLQCDIDFFAATKLLVNENADYPSQKIINYLLKKIGTIFNRDDTLELLIGFVAVNRYDDINRMLSHVDREKALKAIEEPLCDLMCVNTYHIPDVNDDTYVKLKNHGFLSDTFIASVENLDRHLSLMTSKTDWNAASPDPRSDVRIMGTFVRNPALNKTLESKITSLKSVEFFDSGKSIDTWTNLLSKMISLAPAPDAKHGEPCIDIEMKQMEEKEEPNYFFRSLAAKGFTFLRTQGRTVLLKNKAQDILAIKVKKLRENSADLHREAMSTESLRKQSAELKLQSYFPEPVGVRHVSHLLAWLKRRLSTDELKKFTEMVGTFKQYKAYLYKVDNQHQDYFTYLHDMNLTHEKFVEANRIAVSDLCRLLANGVVFHQLADIFHNKEHVSDRDDKGRYIVLSNLLSWYALKYKEPAGSGRLTGWQEAVRFLNIRGTGLADFGDFAPLKDFLGDGSKVKHFFGAALKTYEDETGNYLMANFLAEYQFVLYLNAGFKACKETKSMTDESQVRKVWQDTANLLVSNCALAISILTPQTEEAARRFLLSTVNVERLGRQMQFWMRETEHGFEYLEHVKKNSIPKDIYGSEVRVEVDTKQFRKDTFNPRTKDGRELGFAIDGEHPDLGPVNGQEPVKEKDNLFAWMISAIFNSYHEHALTLSDIYRFNVKKTSQEKSLFLQSGFSHLPTRQYHATLFAMTKRQLAETKVVTRSTQKEIMVTALKAINHKRHYAAATIQEGWHAHKFRRVSEEKKIESEHSGMDKPGSLKIR